jgi:opacity protein-like surface antigen
MRSTALLAATALLLSASAAGAADFGLDEIDLATSQWDGPYVGVVGLAYWSPTFLDSGAGVGALLGLNKALDNNIVVGGEVYAAYETNSVDPDFIALGAEGRVGVVVTSQVMIYGAVGAEAAISLTGLAPGFYGYGGGGVEFGVTEDVSLDLELKSFVGLNNSWSGYEISGSVNWHF